MAKKKDHHVVPATPADANRRLDEIVKKGGDSAGGEKSEEYIKANIANQNEESGDRGNENDETYRISPTINERDEENK
jgi:hypothetical protein